MGDPVSLKKTTEKTNVCETSYHLIKFLCHPKIWDWMPICTLKKSAETQIQENLQNAFMLFSAADM